MLSLRACSVKLNPARRGEAVLCTLKFSPPPRFVGSEAVLTSHRWPRFHLP